MAKASTIAATLVVGVLVSWAIPMARLFDALQPMVTALSIMVAAVFVRLNRGMPTLEWRSLKLIERQNLTEQIVVLTREYGWIIAINSALLLGLVALSVIGKAEVTQSWPYWAQRLTAGIVGAGSTLAIARMTYVVWRDIDVVKLQKHLIDGLATNESVLEEMKSADEKITNIRAASLRKIENPTPKAWGN